MLRPAKFILTTLLALTYILSAKGQLYNLNKEKGLATNHVYCTLVDSKGYLWLGTTDGVYRYNGYTLIRYDYNNGLPNTDVWGLYEDKKGRIWPLHIAQQMGYIENNIYHKLHKTSDTILNEIYATRLFETGDSIVFLNVTSSNLNWSEFGIIANDTLHPKKIYSRLGEKERTFGVDQSYVCMVSDSDFYTYTLSELLKTPYPKKPKALDSVHKPYNLQNVMRQERRGIPFANRYYAHYEVLYNRVNFLDINDFSSTRVKTITSPNQPEEQINYAYPFKDKIYVLTNKGVLSIDSTLEIDFKTSFISLFGTDAFDNFNNTHFQKDTLWGELCATNDRGLFIHRRHLNPFHRINLDLKGYHFAGAKNDSTGFWWNNNTHNFVEIVNGHIIYSRQLPHVYNIHKILHFKDNEYLIINDKGTYWLYGAYDMKTFSQNVNVLDDNGIIYDTNGVDVTNFFVLSDLTVDSDTSFIGLGTALLGVSKFSYNTMRNRLTVRKLNNKRYKRIARDGVHDRTICYTSDKVLYATDNFKNMQYLDQDLLMSLDIRGIEKIIIDSFGNIFVKDYDHLHLFNVQNLQHKILYSEYNLRNALLHIRSNKMTLSGNFGAVQADIKGPGWVCTVCMYPNQKGLNYSMVQDMQVSEKNILLKTDKGAYIINTESGTSNLLQGSDFKFVIGTSKELRNIYEGDTLEINQEIQTLYIDVIKPAGTGNLRIKYNVNNGAYSGSGKQLILPVLKPGKFSTVSLVASDDAWISEPVVFYLYKVPYFWQQRGVKNLLFALLLLAIAGIVYIIVRVTRRIVNDANNRRNQRRELELKSIYSQINPHFIFNTLSTAQYFVRKNRNKEAYDHINQFSDLLRAYIKSSRNKYISIEEEIENLENYLNLQLSRFEEKFDYTIQVDDTLDIKQVKIPSLLLQPLVENALNHGIFHSVDKGMLNISFARDKNEKDTIICIVDDNGIGRKRAKEIRSDMLKKADSYGTILIKELIDTFNKYERIKIFLEYIDKKYPEQGTTVVIHIKNFTYA